MNWKDYQHSKNTEIREQYDRLIGVLQTCNETLPNGGFAAHLVGRTLTIAALEADHGKYGWKNKTPVEMQAINADLYHEMLHYDGSWSNPDVAIARTNAEVGAIYAAIAAYLERMVYCVVGDCRWEVVGIFSDIADFARLSPEHQTDREIILNTFRKSMGTVSYDISLGHMLRMVDPGYDVYRKIVFESDLNDISYLYHYGEYITDNEIRTAQFLSAQSHESIANLAKMIVKAFIRGYEIENKDYRRKKNVTMMFRVGHERLIREVSRELNALGLTPLFLAPDSSKPNQQFDFDHRFDKALYTDEEYLNNDFDIVSRIVELLADDMRLSAGPILIESFGEEPFNPVQKATCIEYNETQQSLMPRFRAKKSFLRNKAMPSSERSFTIIALPSPEIGPDFEQIFADTMFLNQLDTEEYQQLQKLLIDVLDQAETVHVKGKSPNRTDITIALYPLDNPEKETNFTNCGADVNIPVGEVFTSPKLVGTNGLLHVSEAFLNNCRFQNLEITFVDGFARGGTCSNYEDEAKNREYVAKTLFFPHEQLPIGEFAIGTNTFAYVMAKKYGIVEKMPVLIVEKMAPHFAIGDTCYSHQEDHITFNPVDGKKVCARENDLSALRKTDPDKAYTGIHTDITLDYECLENIDAVLKDGSRIPIIREGRFVVPGTEKLNAPLDNKA